MKTPIYYLTLLVLLASTQVVWSFQCCAPRTIAEEWQKASAIFAGAVTAIIELPQPGDIVDGLATSHRVVFKVERSWKGVQGQDTVAVAVPGPGGCTFDLKVGETYLVYAYGQKELNTRISSRGIFGTGMCSRTKPLSQAGEDIIVLDKEAKQNLQP